MLASVTDDNYQFIIKTMLLLITLRQNNRCCIFSRTLAKNRHRYSAIKKEAYASVKALYTWRH